MGHSETFAIVTEFAKAGYEPVVYPIIPGSDLTSEELVADYGSSADVVMCVGGDGTLNHTMSSMMELDESVRREWATRRIYAIIAAYTAHPKEETLRDMRIFAEHYQIQIPYEKEMK